GLHDDADLLDPGRFHLQQVIVQQRARDAVGTDDREQLLLHRVRRREMARAKAGGGDDTFADASGGHDSPRGLNDPRTTRICTNCPSASIRAGPCGPSPYANGSTAADRFRKLVVLLSNVSFTVPVGPLRCLAMMTSAMLSGWKSGSCSR